MDHQPSWRAKLRHGLTLVRDGLQRSARRVGIARDATPGFCAAPWVDAVVRIDGAVLPCCHNDYRYGTIGATSLPEAWRSPEALDFRGRIARGQYPNQLCADCHRKGKSATMQDAFESLIAQHWFMYDESCRSRGVGPDLELCQLMTRFTEDVRASRRSLRARRNCRRAIASLDRLLESSDSVEARRPLAKLRTITQACLDFMERAQIPKVVATRRQVNLVSICNARCVHCIGLYTGEIVRGTPVDGKRLKRMPVSLADGAFANPGDMTSFFMNGSEFLLHPQWRDFARTLGDAGVRLAMSTNGMLLDARAADALIASGVPLDINFSFDGGTRATVERIRDNVSFDKLVAHTRYFVQRVAGAPGNTKNISLSFVLMQSNIGECADFVRLARSLCSGGPPNLHVVFELLNSAPHPAYNEFQAREWIDLSSPVAKAHLTEAAQVAKEAGIPAFYVHRELSAALAETGAT